MRELEASEIIGKFSKMLEFENRESFTFKSLGILSLFVWPKLYPFMVESSVREDSCTFTFHHKGYVTRGEGENIETAALIATAKMVEKVYLF